MSFRFFLLLLLVSLSFQNFMSAEAEIDEKVEAVWTLEVIGIKAFAKGGVNLPNVSTILSYSHGVTSDSYSESKDANNIHLDEFYIVKSMNALTPYFFQAVLEKKVFPKVILNLEQNDVLIRYELYDAIITIVRPGGSNYNSETPLEEVGFCFKKVKIFYKDKNSKGEVELRNN